MIKTSPTYQAAITADVRRMLIRAVIDIIDPDIVFGAVTSSGEEYFSQPAQIHDKVMTIDPYATLEENRWVLNGRFALLPESGDPDGQTGFVGTQMSKDDGTFDPAFFVEEQFQNVAILQACSVYFPTDDWDGVAEDFTVEVKQGGRAYYAKTFTGNTASVISLSEFTVNNPDAIRVTVTKWSKPGRRVRICEILPGIYEEWDGGMIASFTLRHQGNVACTALPYGTCTIKMDNLDRRFEPRKKDGIFQSIEDRQGIDVYMGPRLADGGVEYVRVGMFYQYSGGWKTGDNGITMQWELVDIVGLLADREYIPPASLPTTLRGWVSSLVAQLGVNFEKRYTVDPNYENVSLTCSDAKEVTGKKCGDILRWVCMASGTWPRADAETGYLAVEPLWSEGNKITLDNLNDYPTMKANSDIAAIIFTLADADKTQYIVSGNSTASSNTLSVSNPFIKTQAQALTAARLILATYGGNQFEITGRGDPASEIGDVDTVWLDESSATTARRIQQDLSFSNGVLMNCKSTLLQADGSFMFRNQEVVTASGQWTAPVGVSQLRIILVGKGGDGQDGTSGTWDAAGEDGADGAGGMVWAGTININPQQAFNVSIGADTVFGPYSSANGDVYSYGYTDIASGSVYGRTGVSAPLPGSGDGGKGGAGGVKGNRHEESYIDEDGFTHYETVIDNYPDPGNPGVNGAAGCIVIWYDRPEASV